jgi:hypothetical protein
MYDKITDQLVDAGLTIINDPPVHYSKDGRMVRCDASEEAYSNKYTIKINFPEYCLIADELGGNISQKGNRHWGGAKYLYAKGSVLRKTTSNQDKHFTLLGFTALMGEPAIYCIIFARTIQNPHIEASIDFTKNLIGDVDNSRFFETNFNKGKLFPAGSECAFRGKKVPYFVRWSEKGSITSTILTDILREFDCRNIFDRSNEHIPFLLLDGHGSWTEYEFLEYINNSKHE